MAELVYIQENQALTTSRLVANKFGKNHKDVVKKVRTLSCSEEFSGRNFALADYLDEQGKKRPEYLVTRDGFVFLVMGFTGNQAAVFKEEYINAFNQMERKLQGLSAPKSLEEMIFYQAKSLLDHSRRLDTVEVTVNKLVENQELAKKDLFLIERSNEKVPEETVKEKIKRIINQYVTATNVDYKAAWSKVYDRLYYRYNVNLKNVKKMPGESTLDSADRKGHIHKIWAIVSEEFIIS